MNTIRIEDRTYSYNPDDFPEWSPYSPLSMALVEEMSIITVDWNNKIKEG